jgi:MFS family permease
MAETTNSPAISPAAAVPANRRWTLILVLSAVTLYWASLYLYVPTLGVYAQNITGSLSVVGLILSMYGLWQAIVRLPLGIAADWLGKRKPFLIVGFALSAVGAYLMGTATGTNSLLVGRSITGLAAATWVPLVVLFSSLFPADQAVKATSLLSIVNSLSRVLATAVTGSLNDAYGFPFAFFLAVGVAGLAILVVLPVREAARAPKRPSVRQIGTLITRRDVLIPALLSAVGQYIAWATTFGFLPILAKNIGASSEMLSLLTSLNLFIGMGGNLITSWLAHKVGNLRLVYISFVILIIGTLAAALAPTIPMLIAAQALIGFGGGIGYPLLMGMSIEKVNEEERATAMGLHQAVYAIGMFAGPWLSGILADAYGIPPMFIITAGGCFFLALALSRIIRK